MNTERSSRWTPRRVAAGLARRARAAITAARRRVDEAWTDARPFLNASTPESTTLRLGIRAFLRRPLLGSGPTVSLTSHGDRVAKVHLAIESIASGSLRPRAIHLWLDDPQIMRDPPRALRRLVKRGLSLGLSQNYGPHTKYYPYLLLDPLPAGPLVTADDDILYPHTWLEGLEAAHRGDTSVIHCYRARRVVFDGEQLAPYLEWPRSHSMQASPLNFLTGVSGVIYPAEFLRRVKAEGDVFMGMCPRADDVWLHRCAVEFGFDVHQVLSAEEHEHWPMIPGSQEQTLMAANVLGGENDRQIRATYSEENLATMRSLARAEGAR